MVIFESYGCGERLLQTLRVFPLLDAGTYGNVRMKLQGQNDNSGDIVLATSLNEAVLGLPLLKRGHMDSFMISCKGYSSNVQVILALRLHGVRSSTTNQPNNQPVSQAVSQTINQPINQRLNYSIIQSINQSINQPINQTSINQPTNYPIYKLTIRSISQ